MADPVTIIVASYNYEAFIEQTLRSIQAQSSPDWEALVVDDGSSDGSLAVIDRFCSRDPRFRLLQHEGGGNRGLAASLQLAIRQAACDRIAFCESDDWWEPAFLQELSARAHASPGTGVVFSDVILAGESAAMETHCALVRKHFRSGGRAIALYERMQNAVPTMSCAMVSTGSIRSCDFNARFAPSLDMWLWAQLVVKTDFLYVDLPLCHWRQHEGSYMKQEVDPARLDMTKVHGFHADIRELLHPAATRARDGGMLQRLRGLGRLLRGR